MTAKRNPVSKAFGCNILGQAGEYESRPQAKTFPVI